MSDINREINRLIRYGVEKSLIALEDAVYAANRIIALLGINNFEMTDCGTVEYPSEALEPICEWAAAEGKIDDTRDSKDQLDTEIMACMTPRPSEVISKFYSIYDNDRKAATDYYYDLSRATNYIRRDRIEKDKLWTSPTPYGELVITINLSKPEKDPKAIAAAKNAPQSGYPKCALCRENEGFLGSANQAARGNHRLIPLTLCGEKWFLQYSPYVYYNEHCIVLSEEHRPMKVSRASFEHLLDFVTVLPHYFVGSNADLPIVGGSILSHDHFQGGNCEFPMAKAPVDKEITFKGFEDVKAGIVKWPMSVIRLRSESKEKLIDLADKILTKWREYSDETADILAYTEENGEKTPHNTITPIARRREGDFELDLVLRNNRTTEEHPLGLFHPHAEYHHIKKENIGLIEVMGLAILPARLVPELDGVAQALAHPDRAEEIFSNPVMEKHKEWFEELKARSIAPENARKAVEDSVGEIFGKILSNAGVYKDTQSGREAFLRFCESV